MAITRIKNRLKLGEWRNILFRYSPGWANVVRQDFMTLLPEFRALQSDWLLLYANQLPLTRNETSFPYKISLLSSYYFRDR